MSTPPDRHSVETESTQPESSEPESSEAESSEAESGDTSWWNDERMPWAGTPSKSDKMCFGAIMGYTIYSLVLLPLRPVLIANPLLAVFVTGSVIGTVVAGGFLASGGSYWWLGTIVIAAVSVCKFDWIYWWAGKLWGQGLVDYLMQDRSDRAKRRAEKAQNLAKKHAVLSMAATYIPFVPMPTAVIYAALGKAGVGLKKFLALDVLFALVSRAIYFTLGYVIGEPVVAALETYSRYAWYITIALVIGIFVVTFMRQSRQQREAQANADSKP